MAVTSSDILTLSNLQAKELAGQSFQIQGQRYQFRPYDPGQRGQTPWRTGAEGKAYPLLDSNGRPAAYLKFFAQATAKRLQRTHWLIAQQMHLWAEQLQAAPSLWVDSRQHSRPAAVGFDFTGCLARAVPGMTWLEVKYRIQEKDFRPDDEFRWRCFCDLVLSVALLERAGILHGDLSPNNIIVDPNAPRGQPALYLIDFDAFVAPAAGAVGQVTLGEGGTYGTEGYCPPDLTERANRGDDSVLPYSDRFGRDMLALELLCLGPDHSPDEPPVKWDKAVLRRRWEALTARLAGTRAAALQPLRPPHVFTVAERQRTPAAQLVADLGLTLPPRRPPPQPPPAPIPPQPPPPVRPPPRQRRSRRTVVWSVTGILLLLAAVMTLVNWRGDSSSPVVTPQYSSDVNTDAPPEATESATEPAPEPAPEPSPEPAPQSGSFTGTRAGQERDDNGLQMKLCWCPAGSFTMGSPPTEPDRDDDENQVSVRLSQGFWLGKYEVTQADWRAVMGSNPSFFSSTGGGSSSVRGMATTRFPVETVTWFEASEFCRKLTEQEHQAGRLPADWEYRLPTEAQWEYACRAGTVTATAFGDKLSSRQANFDGNHPYNGAQTGPYLTRTTEVGSYAANAWGLHDMHGNVWEWCRDWYQSSLPGGTDPEASSGATDRVLRGGGWDDYGRFCRSALRSRIDPGWRNLDYGFRLAVVRSGS